jgi:hypothetical protein
MSQTTGDRPLPGDIGLTSIAGRVGRLIRFGQFLNGDGFTTYEHAFVVVDRLSDSPTETTLVEAEPGGARVTLLSEYDGREIVWLRCPEQFRWDVAHEAADLLGTPYSFADYASLAALRLHIPAPHVRAYVMSSKHMICSQLADEAARRGGWHLFTDMRWPGDVTPGDLYRLYERQQSQVTS